MKVWKVHEFDREDDIKCFNKSNNWVAFDDIEQAFDFIEIYNENDEEKEFNYIIERTEMEEIEFNELNEFDGF